MKEYVCSVCGYVYDEAKGIPEAGIAPGTRWEDLPEDWVCPLCGATKAEFEARSADASLTAPLPAAQPEASDDLQELTPWQASALCSNLARGCEKQYKPEEAALFTQLADYFRSIAPPANAPDAEQLLALIESDLSDGIPAAHGLAAQAKDRGALRALVWNEKVTKILRSLLKRYQRQGDAMLDNTGVYVCVICGFVYVGDTPPALCPVCKAPQWKLEKVEGRVS
ncbi:MAG TPA: rubredoxin [Candidatus Limiplasma sp.]|nr:rubredoxin [Candidatus Limiplasma sp.]